MILDIRNKAQSEEADRRHAERVRTKCSCLGEVENCHRCYGKGYYYVDGYGNIVA